MKRNFKKIVGGVVLVLALHYVLDEPHRRPLVQSALTHLNRAVLLISRNVNRTLLLLKLKKIKPQKIEPRSLVDNVSFEQWEGLLLRGWFSKVTIGASAVVKQEMEIVQHGQSAVRLEHNGVGHCGNVRQELPHELIPWLHGRRLTFSAWALSKKPGAPCLHIKINDNDEMDFKACLQLPSETWQLVTVEHTIGPEVTRVELNIDISREAMGEIVGWVYVDNALVLSELLSSEPPSTISASSEPS